MTNTISGKILAQTRKDILKQKIQEFKENHPRPPHLSVILIGSDPASKIYVSSKEKACKKVGMTTETHFLAEDIKEGKVINLIRKMNDDTSIDGILLQLPVPKHLSSQNLIKNISPLKDVDGLTPYNQGLLSINRPLHVPCTPKGIIEMIKSVDFDFVGKRAVVIGRSTLVGSPISQLLIHHHSTVTVVHSKTTDPKKHTLEADVLVVAAGKPKLVKGGWVKEGAVVIDVGIHRTDNGLCGDVDFDSVSQKASWITPVPGGVGPMTICSLLENCFNACKMQFSDIKV